MTWNCMVLSLDEFDGSSNLPTWAVWTFSSQNCIQIQQPQIKHPKEVGVGQVCTWLALLLVLNTLKKTKVHNMENPWTSFKINGFNRKWPTNLSGWIIIIQKAESQCCHAAMWGWFPKPNRHSSDVTTWGYSKFIQFFLGWCPHQNLEKVDFCGVSVGFLMDFHGFSPEFRMDFPIRGPGSKTSSAWWDTGHNSFPMNWRSHTPGLAGAYVVGLSNDIYIYIYMHACMYVCVRVYVYIYIYMYKYYTT